MQIGYTFKHNAVRTLPCTEFSYGGDEGKVRLDIAARFIRHWVGVKKTLRIIAPKVLDLLKYYME
ncbi:hypothetical protein PDUR_25845 [Paenibacillus durus]|uniref:Uncharacterized protein n=1 Tax=Paenibacillus durus TaxID=44251 RepID=A0A089HV37_PAEDU|nr:hypothetical protein PDUR_25845 [Paenibacillus durus]